LDVEACETVEASEAIASPESAEAAVASITTAIAAKATWSMTEGSFLNLIGVRASMDIRGCEED